MQEKAPKRKDSEEIGKGKSNFFERLNILYGCTLELFQYKVLFFACYGAFACLYTFIPLYFKQLGLSASQTGILVGLRPLCQAIGAPFWGILADRYKRRKAILFIGSTAWLIKNMLILVIRPSHVDCLAKPATFENETTLVKKEALVESLPNAHVNNTLPSVAAVTSLPPDKYKYLIQVDSAELLGIFYIFLVLVLIGELFGSIVHPLLDGCTVDYLGQDRKVYGRIRLWGSVGMVLANLVAGLIINNYTYEYCGEIRKHYAIAFYIFAAFMAVMIVGLPFIKIVYADAPKESLSKIKELFNSRLKFSFWFVAIANGMGDGFQADFNAWFLDELKATSFQVGLAAAMHFIISTMFFFVSNYILEVLGYSRTITVGLASYSVVFVCYSFTQSPWVALVLFSVVGGVFAVTWTACVAYVGSISTVIGLGAAAQGILNGLFVGVGNGSGTIFGGLLVGRIGIRSAYRLFAAFLALVMFLFLACQWQGQNTDENSEDSKSKYRKVSSQEEDSDD